MAILVVDDSLSIRMLLAGILEDLQLECIEAESGETALSILATIETLPSLVVLDIGLPGIDGYETAAKIKTIAGDRHLPIIFLTSETSPDALSRCLAIGDDYIAKPFTVDMVCSKIKAHRRVSMLYKQLAEQYVELKHHHARVDLEHDMVESIFSNQFVRHIDETENLRYHFSPKSIFNGDVILATVGPSGNQYIAIGDVTGHGLPAAVGAMPVYPAFRTMANKGLSIGVIASEMNGALSGLLPDNMMLAASLIELNSAGDTLTVWAGGVPAMVHADSHGNIKQLIEPKHCPLAMLDEAEFSQDVSVYSVSEGDCIYLFTDGVEESRNSQGEMFGEERLHALFDGSSSNMFDRILDGLAEFTGAQEQDDDITLIELVCRPIDIDNEETAQRSLDNALPWSLRYELTADQLRQSNPVAQIIRMLSNANGVNVHQDYISTIISELFSNALEHGLLNLESSMKETDDGFMEYYNLRQQRLAALDSGSITIQLDFCLQGDNPQITIKVKDTGSGFDFENISQVDDEDSFGRGFDLIRGLCDSVEYSDGGSCVTVAYRLS